MIAADDLIALVRNYNPKTNATRLRAAYEFGRTMHDGQFRHSGEPYFTHPVTVAAILTEQRLDDATIITALLHDTIEDTKASYGEIADRFGDEVAMLVDGVTKLTNLQISNRTTNQAENFRKLFIAMSKDLRVILVKLADRLHNMRTIKAVCPEKQVQKARETMDIYAPLAGRMGMQSTREELEDLSFRVVNSEGRQSIMRRFINMKHETGDIINRITGDMRIELEKAGIEAEVFGRAKKPYSIWRKMQEKKQTFSRLSDIYGFRILTQSEEDCYRTLGAIHQRWRAVPGRFKDYISQPKTNGYRSIHTTVSGRDGKLVEVQIRTVQMHDVAETGVAAHWSYRDGVRSANPFAVDPAKWISSLTERFDTEDDNEGFLETVKLEMYSDRVFCFTPKGDVVKLPRGATPIDFAYAIHTRIGEACVGAKVDTIRVPLWTRLRNGQSVDIITAEGQAPQVSWLDIATTGKARSAIRRSLRQVDRERFIKLGTELARVAFENVGRKSTDKVLATVAKHLHLSGSNELLARLGRAELTARDVVQAVYPELVPDEGEQIPLRRAVIGLQPGQSFERAPCCQPLPGERIIGITFRGKGVVLHAINCDRLSEYEDQPERWVDLNWHSGTHPSVYAVTLDLTIRNDAQKANIRDLKFVDRKPDFFRLFIDIEMRDVEQLHSLMLMLEAESDVAALERYREQKIRSSVEIG
ncbi:MAG: bifunctional (p)ppGpp synthetase/guanosine-3',5'-bis(diphosphate) 3'-pyrophosphohydrolase [Rhodobacteraceae bacterium]|nr:bifunctional (p)ppGpp synthetase/guanosine-3',5'-bis(diphosphate) 3'-pyrophosphohydrolase [Paracoccaceae bacterium]